MILAYWKRGIPISLMQSLPNIPNLKMVVYTLGKKGSVVLDSQSGIHYESWKLADVKVVSTVSAGDCFGAIFLSTYFNGGSISEAIHAATERSNIVVARRESVPF